MLPLLVSRAGPLPLAGGALAPPTKVLIVRVLGIEALWLAAPELGAVGATLRGVEMVPILGDEPDEEAPAPVA